jgi:hypothetical protein
VDHPSVLNVITNQILKNDVILDDWNLLIKSNLSLNI